MNIKKISKKKKKRIKENKLPSRVYRTEYFLAQEDLGTEKLTITFFFFLILLCSLYIFTYIYIYPYHTTVLGLSFYLPFLTELFDCLSFEDLAPGM